MPTIHHGSRQRFVPRRPRQCPERSRTAQIGAQRVFPRSAGTEQELKAFCQTKTICQWKRFSKICKEVIARLLKKQGSFSADIAEIIDKSITILQIMSHKYSAAFPIFTVLFFPSFHFVSQYERSVWLKSLAIKTRWKEVFLYFSSILPFARTDKTQRRACHVDRYKWALPWTEKEAWVYPFFLRKKGSFITFFRAALT